MKPLLSVAIAALALAVPATAQRPAAVVPIALYSYGYAPSPIVLRAGVPATMVSPTAPEKGTASKPRPFSPRHGFRVAPSTTAKSI